MLREHEGNNLPSVFCLAGAIPREILNGDYSGALQRRLSYDIFGKDNFYLGIQNHFLDDDKPATSGTR